MNNHYKGARWLKCDLHLHTPASECFLNKSITPKQWVEACLQAGLDCVAVTDHNTGAWIDCIKEASNNTRLTVFPGVEITCDTSKIHLLILFELSTTTQKVEDFLITCGIPRQSFASVDAHSSMNINEVAQKANEIGAIVIPAHIDEFNGVAYEASPSSLNNFLSLKFIHAVQFVHKEFLDPSLTIKNNEELLSAINNYYGKNSSAIGENDIKNGFQGLQTAIKQKKSLLTFSDNPDPSDPSKHGLGGIGIRYSWVKMDGKPSLEGLRQAFIMQERTRHYFNSEKMPYKIPNLWIRKITIQNTTLTQNEELFEIEFNPQLTAIIGGRGSGKSSVLRFLRGVFNRIVDLEGLAEIKDDFTLFFQKEDSDGRGVLKDNSKIEVFFVRDQIDYKVVFEQGKTTYVERFDSTSSTYQIVADDSFVDFFKFEEYSQKQIFSIAQKPNSLRKRIDDAIANYSELDTRYSQALQEYKRLKEDFRTLKQATQNKGKLITEINDLNSKIELLKQSGISNDISRQQSFVNQKNHIKLYIDEIIKIIKRLKEFHPELESFGSFNTEPISAMYRDEIAKIFQQITISITTMGEHIRCNTSELEQMVKLSIYQIKETNFYTDYQSCKQQFEIKKSELERKGVTDLTDFEKYNNQIVQKKKELEDILEKEDLLNSIVNQIQDQKVKIEKLRDDISKSRISFVRDCINNDKIKVDIRPYFDKEDFKLQFRKIIQKTTSYERGIDTIMGEVYTGNNVLDNLNKLKERLHALHENKLSDNYYDGRFSGLIEELSENQMDEIDLLYPQDQIVMKYKGRDGNYKSLSVASAGQKTTAILTFILSFGDVPLILDQPEDDLDNRLVYDLIVEKIRQIKEKRQVIVVTHNANIPVNGDAEYVVSLSSNSHFLQIQAEGTIEDEKVKNEICEVMEGGVEAFKTRAKRYESLNKGR